LTLPDPPILVITDRRMAARPLVDVIGAALDGGCRWVLLREPDLDRDALVDLGRPLEARCARHAALLSVSADIAAAATIGAGGIHLPQRLADQATLAEARDALRDGALVGVSCHSRNEALAAQVLGADYVTLSPAFLTDSKPGYGPALGVETLATIAAELDIPVLALAGIGPDNAASVRASGVAGIAVMGLVMRAPAPAVTFRDLQSAWVAKD
jgi:thiamine-phosphate pyrophosphorylase